MADPEAELEPPCISFGPSIPAAINSARVATDPTAMYSVRLDFAAITGGGTGC